MDGRRNKSIAWIIIFATLTSTGAFSKEKSNNLDVVADVRCDEPVSIVLTISNKTSKRLKLQKDELPWLSPWAVSMRGYLLDNGQTRRLREGSAPATHLGEITLAPGRKISGELSLTSRFRDFEDTHASADIIVFYTLSAPRRKSFPFEPKSGLIFIPKKRFLWNKCPTHIDLPK